MEQPVYQLAARRLARGLSGLALVTCPLQAVLWSKHSLVEQSPCSTCGSGSWSPDSGKRKASRRFSCGAAHPRFVGQDPDSESPGQVYTRYEHWIIKHYFSTNWNVLKVCLVVKHIDGRSKNYLLLVQYSQKIKELDAFFCFRRMPNKENCDPILKRVSIPIN